MDLLQPLQTALKHTSDELQRREKELLEKHQQLDAKREKLEKEWSWIQKSTGMKSRDPELQNRDDDFPTIIDLNVGGQKFTTTLETLKNSKSMLASMFSGRHPVIKDCKGRYFINRDGNSFKYILEYLTYGTITTAVEPEILPKLMIDLDYFGIEVPDFEKKEPLVWLNVRCSRQIGNGQWIHWDQSKEVPATYFQHNADTITVLKPGIYQIYINYVAQCSTHGSGAGNVDLYVSDNVVARSYHGQNDGHQQSRFLQEILTLKNNDTIKVKYHSNANMLNDALCNSLTLVQVSPISTFGLMQALTKSPNSVILNVHSSVAVSNGNYINWNEGTMVPTNFFTHNGSHTITVLQDGLYRVSVRYTCQCSSHGQGSGNIDLHISGVVVSRVYHGQNDGYYQSRHLEEILKLKKNDTVQVMYRSNSNIYADRLGNSLTIILLE